MYQSIPSIAIPLGNPKQIFKNCQIPAPWEHFLDLGPLILIDDTLFIIFKTSIINLSIEYLQIRREKTDLSMKNRFNLH